MNKDAAEDTQIRLELNKHLYPFRHHVTWNSLGRRLSSQVAADRSLREALEGGPKTVKELALLVPRSEFWIRDRLRGQKHLLHTDRLGRSIIYWLDGDV